MNKQQGPKVLVLDIETSPLIVYTFGTKDQNIGLNQIKKDSHILSWAAKWFGDSDDKVMYMDQRNAKNIEDESKILKVIWKLMDEADIILGQNSKQFDIKILNSRFVYHGMKPPSSFKQIDTLTIARKHFKFTSNKLEYMTKKLCKKHKKSDHKKFPGFDMWSECLAGNREAWNEMKKYNIRDVLATEELYNVFKGWDSSINFNLYSDDETTACKCGSKSFAKNGFFYSAAGKFQRWVCKSCGCETRSKENLLSKEKRKSLTPGTTR